MQAQILIMNQKPTTSKILIILVLIALAGVVGYLVKTDRISWLGWRDVDY